MFTGLIQRMGLLERWERGLSGARIHVRAGAWGPPLALGESVAVNGVCLTVAGVGADTFTADVLAETLSRTNLPTKQEGSHLNLERALRVGDSLGGHFVTGHIDGTARVGEIRREGRDWILRLLCGEALLSGMVLKGSVACDGASLTIAALASDSFNVHLIPHTWENTDFHNRRAGDDVNIETDLIGKHVSRVLSGAGPDSALTLDRLRKAGFGR